MAKDRQDSMGSVSGGTATATVLGPGRDSRGGGLSESADEAQPDEYPIDAEEWASPLRGTAWRTLVAGFLHVVRLRGELTTKKLRAVWQAEFDAWRDEPAA